MTSFQLSVSPHRRAAAQFVTKVHRRLQKAYADAPDVTQTAIADALGVHRSVINRQLRGRKDMTISRAAELAWAMGYEADFELLKPEPPNGSNISITLKPVNPFTEIRQSSSALIENEMPTSKKKLESVGA